MTRNFAERFNHRYGEVFPVPKAFSYSEDLVKILSLDGSGKMSKSEQQMNTIYLNDDDELITKKIMKAKTDQGPISINSEKPEYIQGLFTLLGTGEQLRKFLQNLNMISIIVRSGMEI